MRRSRERHFIAVFIIIAALGMVGRFDYADALYVEAEEKLARPLRASMLDTSTNPATTAECERGGVKGTVLTINTRPDGIQWFRRSCLAPKT